MVLYSYSRLYKNSFSIVFFVFKRKIRLTKFLLIAQDLNKSKKNPEHTFVDIVK